MFFIFRQMRNGEYDERNGEIRRRFGEIVWNETTNIAKSMRSMNAKLFKRIQNFDNVISGLTPLSSITRVIPHLSLGSYWLTIAGRAFTSRSKTYDIYRFCPFVVWFKYGRCTLWYFAELHKGGDRPASCRSLGAFTAYNIICIFKLSNVHIIYYRHALTKWSQCR